MHHTNSIMAEGTYSSVKVVGVTFDGRQELIRQMTDRSVLHLVPEPNNPFDENAIAVVEQTLGTIGYIPRSLTHEYRDHVVFSHQVVGGNSGYSYGVHLALQKREQRDDEQREQDLFALHGC